MAKGKEQAPVDESFDFSDVDDIHGSLLGDLDEYAEQLQEALEALELDDILDNLGGDEDIDLFEDEDDIDELFADDEELDFDYILG